MEKQPVEIISNGSKWAGEEPDSVEKLLEVLAEHPLDPSFDDERYGRFFFRQTDGRFRAFGNFATLSHVFNITGEFEEMYRLALALKKNRKSEEYLRLKHAEDR